MTTEIEAHDEICPFLPTSVRRPHYFDRQLFNASDLNAAIRYDRDHQRRHNRNVVGWGIVCGLGVTRFESDDDEETAAKINTLNIHNGFGLTPIGDELHVEEPFQWDTTEAIADCLGDPLECHDEGEVDVTPIELWLVAEPHSVGCGARPVLPDACSPQGANFEYTRFVEGLRLRFVRELETPETPDIPFQLVICRPQLHTLPCLPANASNYLALAKIVVQRTGDCDLAWQIQHIDLQVRTLLLSNAMLMEAIRQLACQIEQPVDDEDIEPNGDGEPTDLDEPLSAARADGGMIDGIDDSIERLKAINGVSSVRAHALYNAEIRTLNAFANHSPEALLEIFGGVGLSVEKIREMQVHASELDSATS